MKQHTDKKAGTDLSEPHFSAILTPNRSLWPRGFMILMSLICLISFTAGFIFMLKGAWPVFGFFGLDVILIYLAFKLNYQAGRLHETIDLNQNELKVTRIFPSGKSESWKFNPYWVRLELVDVNGRAPALSLRSHGKYLLFAKFLSEDELKEFAEVFKSALYTCRHGEQG